MANGDVHTVPHGGAWVNRIEGGEDMFGSYETKSDAVQAGRLRASQDGVEHLIHNEDGTIGERNSYGNDPQSSKG